MWICKTRVETATKLLESIRCRGQCTTPVTWSLPAWQDAVNLRASIGFHATAAQHGCLILD